MTLEIDENRLATTLDGMKMMAEETASSGNPYGRMYSYYISAYSDIGLYISVVNGRHVVVKSSDM